MNILLLSRYDSRGASSRLRMLQYLPFLRAAGIQVTMAPLFDNRYLENLYAGRPAHAGYIAAAYWQRLKHLLSCRKFDLIWLDKELFPWLPAWVEAAFFRQGIPVAVDYDDATFHRYDQHKNPCVRKFLGKKISGIMRRAALVVAGNDYLAEHACASGARQVEILPTVIDLDRYPPDAVRRARPFTIGWIGIPVTATDYLSGIANALRTLQQAIQCRVLLVGPDNVQLDGVHLDWQPWSETTEVSSILDFDVGIMPLPDRPFERGKCGYKLIQYMACARPVVASPIGVNNQLVQDGVNGFLATDTRAWVAAIRALHGNGELRDVMGRRGRELVERHYCLQVTAPRLAALLQRTAQA